MKTAFQVRCPDQDGDEWHTIDAVDAWDAACEYAEECDDSSGGDLMDDGATCLIIVKVREGVERKFNCSKEYEPNYYANEVDPKPEEPDQSGIPY